MSKEDKIRVTRISDAEGKKTSDAKESVSRKEKGLSYPEGRKSDA